jgi:CheY-like chemotaxis protein
MATILVVDDYSVTLRVLGHILEHGGYDVLTAGNGMEALETLAEMPVDLVISDIAMPEMDGLSLLRNLRADERFESLPIIMLTASGQDEDRRVAETTGANGFLTKPVGSAELLDAVGRFVS